MNGEEKSAEERLLEEKELELATMMMRRGVMPVPKPPHTNFLTVPTDDLTLLSPDQLDVMALDIARYSFYLQSLINLLEGRANFCRRQIRRLVGHKLGQYRVYGREEQWIAAISASEEAGRWRELQDRIQWELDMLAYYPLRVSELSHLVRDLNQSRRQTNGKT